jgi:ABC-type uncharacterized transport system substrate-binding protein
MLLMMEHWPRCLWIFKLGKESADLTLAVLAGQDPATTPIRLNENPSVFVSAKVAANLGVDIEEFRKRPNLKIVDR